MEIETLQDLYLRLVEALQNELEVSELLPCQPEIVELTIELIKRMTLNLKENKHRMTSFAVEQHQIELERITYLRNNYLRTRLKKIESSTAYLINMLRTNIDRAHKYMSPAETKYLDRYNESIDSYMMNVVLKDMPENMRRFRLANMISLHEEKAKREYAFVRGKEEATIVDGENEVALEPDVCRILSVYTIIDELEKNSIQFQLI